MSSEPINAAATYRVQLKRPIKVGVLKMLPRDEHTMIGAFLLKLIEEHGADAVVKYTVA